MAKEMMEGNIAMAEMAIRGGCRAFFGYPITPQSPFLEYMSERMREVGGEFCQCESEIASSNMLMGAAAAGARVCTATAGMGPKAETKCLRSAAPVGVHNSPRTFPL